MLDAYWVRNRPLRVGLTLLLVVVFLAWCIRLID